MIYIYTLYIVFPRREVVDGHDASTRYCQGDERADGERRCIRDATTDDATACSERYLNLASTISS